LVGDFTTDYRYAHLACPYLRSSGCAQTLAALQPWDTLGFPTFSGMACYRKCVSIPPAAGRLALDLGRVEDLAEIAIDGRRLAVTPWPPYTAEIKDVEPGEHELVINIANAPANRLRAARLPAGLLGPVRLWAES
ncbi:MAG: hypothetical protein PHR35_04595, partial [Kiritimatiellae bacterium]|nr:hypothetical protein [Kiritimatiellia bacterium]